MQQIERYGVIALVFMLVTIVAVYLWEDDGATSLKKRGPEIGREVQLASGMGQPDLKLNALQERSKSKKADRARGETGRGNRGGQNGGGALLSSNNEKVSLRDGLKHTSLAGETGLQASLGFDSSGIESESRVENDRRRAKKEDQVGPKRGGRGNERALGFDGFGPSIYDKAKSIADGGGSKPKTNGGQAGNSKKTPSGSKSTKVAGSKCTVRAGDSLSRIAKRELGNEGRWMEIAKLNGIGKPYVINEKDVLVLPGRGAARKAQTVAYKSQNAKSVPAGSGRRYTVKSGEVLGVIAQRECGSVKTVGAILALNSGLKADRIFEGMVIMLPASTPARARRSGSSTSKNRVAARGMAPASAAFTVR